MSKLSISNVLSTTFGFSWRNFIPLSIVYLLLSALLLVPFYYLAQSMFPEFFADPMGALQAWGDAIDAGDSDVEQQTLVQMQRLNGLSNLMQLGSTFIGCIFGATLIDAMIRGKSPWVPAFNMGTLRYLVGYLFVIVVAIASVIAAMIVGFIVAGLGSMIMPGEGMDPLSVFIAIVVAVIPFIYIMIRVSLIPVDMVVAEKIRIVEGWQLMAGNTGRTFWAYFVSGLVILAMIAIGMAAIVVLLMLGGGGEFAAAFEDSADPEFAEVMSLFKDLFLSPLGIAAMVLYLLLTLFMTIVQYAVPAAVYKELTELDRSHEEPDEVDAVLV